MQDQRFKDLLNKALKAGYVEQGVYKPNTVGTPQGSIISPILCNILLDKFDKFLTNTQDEFNIGKEKRKNPVYRRLQNVGASPRYIRRSNIGYRMPNDPNYKRMR